MSKQPATPSKEVLEALLAEQFTTLPEPDPARLAAVRRRLPMVEKRSTPWRPLMWWLLGALSVSMASAAFLARQVEEAPTMVEKSVGSPIEAPEVKRPSGRMQAPTDLSERPAARPDHRFGY